MADRRYTIRDIVDSKVAEAPEDRAHDVAQATIEEYARVAVAADIYEDAITRGLSLDEWLAAREAYKQWLHWQSALRDLRKLSPNR